MKTKLQFQNSKIHIPVRYGYDAVRFSDIKYIRYDKPYSTIYCIGNAKYQVQVSLKYLLGYLGYKFFKCNHSTIINMNYYKKCVTQPDPMVYMEDGTAIYLSIRRKSAFRKYLYQQVLSS